MEPTGGRTSEALFKETDIKRASGWKGGGEVQGNTPRREGSGVPSPSLQAICLSSPKKPAFPLHFHLLSIRPEGHCLSKACLSGQTIAAGAGTGRGSGGLQEARLWEPQDGDGDISEENDTTVFLAPSQDISGAGSPDRQLPQADPHPGFCPSATPLSHLFLTGPSGTSETAP